MIHCVLFCSQNIVLETITFFRRLVTRIAFVAENFRPTLRRALSLGDTNKIIFFYLAVKNNLTNKKKHLSGARGKVAFMIDSI